MECIECGGNSNFLIYRRLKSSGEIICTECIAWLEMDINETESLSGIENG